MFPCISGVKFDCLSFKKIMKSSELAELIDSSWIFNLDENQLFQELQRNPHKKYLFFGLDVPILSIQTFVSVLVSMKEISTIFLFVQERERFYNHDRILSYVPFAEVISFVLIHVSAKIYGRLITLSKFGHLYFILSKEYPLVNPAKLSKYLNDTDIGSLFGCQNIRDEWLIDSLISRSINGIFFYERRVSMLQKRYQNYTGKDLIIVYCPKGIHSAWTQDLFEERGNTFPEYIKNYLRAQLRPRDYSWPSDCLIVTKIDS